MEKKRVLLGCFCAAFGEVLFGLSYIFTRNATSKVEPVELLGWRFLIAFLAINLLVAFRVIKIDFRGKRLLPLLVIVILDPAIYFISETMGIKLTSASETGAFLACIPTICLVMSALMLKKKPTKRQIIGIQVTFIGVLVTVLVVSLTFSLSIPGYLFLTSAVFSYTFYSVFVEKNTVFTEAEITYSMLGTGALVYASLALLRAGMLGEIRHLVMLPLQNTSFLIAVLYQGIGCSILAFFMFNTAIATIGVNRTSSFLGVSTVVSIVAGVLVLHEHFSSIQAIGALIIVVGIYIANKKGAYKE